jgi:hypothetical protein
MDTVAQRGLHEKDEATATAICTSNLLAGTMPNAGDDEPAAAASITEEPCQATFHYVQQKRKE